MEPSSCCWNHSEFTLLGTWFFAHASIWRSLEVTAEEANQRQEGLWYLPDSDENVLLLFVRLVCLDVRFLTFLIVSDSLGVLLPVLLRLENPPVRFCSLRSVESFSLTVQNKACREECSMWAWKEGTLCSCLVFIMVSYFKASANFLAGLVLLMPSFLVLIF